MADERSWTNVINWVKSVCKWGKCTYAGSLTFRSGGEIGDFSQKKQMGKFIVNLMIAQRLNILNQVVHNFYGRNAFVLSVDQRALYHISRSDGSNILLFLSNAVNVSTQKS